MSNHGGMGNDCFAGECILVPFIVHGTPANNNDNTNNNNLGNSIRTVDLAPSVVSSLGISPSAYWTGKGTVYQPIGDKIENSKSSNKGGLIGKYNHRIIIMNRILLRIFALKDS